MAADPRPANDRTPAGPSLFDRAWGAARVRPGPAPAAAPPSQPRERPDRRTMLIAALIVAGPLATLIGAHLLTHAARRETAELATQAAPLLAARAEHARAQALLAGAWSRQPLGATIEAVARALPPEASLLRAERLADGRLAIEVTAPDPDRLTAAFRREGALAGLRATAQVPGDGAMRVTLEQGR